ncbi:MAG: hypothetical protein V2A54_02285 [Bacteroidota bacterium]
MKQKLIAATTGMLVILMLCIVGNAKAQDDKQSGNDNSQSFSKTVEGTLISKNGLIVKFQPKAETNLLPVKDSLGILSKYFETTIGKFNTTGWMDIGKMKVISADKNMLTLKLIEELSIITKNGEKVNHFKPGTVVRFTWAY